MFTYHYFYNNCYTISRSLTSYHDSEIGVGHAAEMPYFFEVPFKTPGWPNAPDIALSKQLVKMWVNFARDQ